MTLAQQNELVAHTIAGNLHKSLVEIRKLPGTWWTNIAATLVGVAMNVLYNGKFDESNPPTPPFVYPDQT